MRDADGVHVVDEVRTGHVDTTFTDRLIMFDQGIVRFRSCCKERFARIPENFVTGDRSAQATSSQVDSNEVETITNLVVSMWQQISPWRVLSLTISLHKLGESQADQDARATWLIQKWTNSTLKKSAHAVNLYRLQ